MFEAKLNQMIKEMSDSNVSSEKLMAAQGQSAFPTKKVIHKINILGGLGKNYITPRGLKAHLINSLVKVQGIVTRMSIVQQKLKQSYHYCE